MAMNPSPAQQWSELSALYEHADGLAAGVLADWLAKLAREHHPLLPQLQRMLAARAEFETNDFLGTLPKLAGSGQAPVAWAEGRQVGAYRLLRPLGEGGMAEVWLAERADGAIKRRVAIKLPYPRPGRETFAVRFDRERDILATLRHPNIAGLYDAGVTPDGQAWLALEYVDGEPLAAWCDQQRLGLRERVMLFRQVLLAVQHAHTNLVIHRDLKPGNILVTPQGEVRLLDFGIAKLLEAEGDAIAETELTRQAGRTMTPRYASPEQLTGAPLTTGSDVYSLGVVFYELLCGERPYELKVESAGQLEHAILEVEPRAPSRRALSESSAGERGGISVKALRRALAPELDAIALRCLAKQPAARYASVDAVIADIDRWLGGEAVLARAPGAWYRFRKFAARHRLGVALGAAAVVSLVATTAVAVVMGLQAREESARAVAARDFMLDIFKRADQEKSRGADITARDILETGRKELLSRSQGDPQLTAELLRGIGETQSYMSEYVSATSTFASVAKIHSQLHQARDEALARADQADAYLRAGDLDRAMVSIRQARGVVGQPAGDPGLNARYNEIEGWVAAMRGNAVDAKALFQQSRRQATAAHGPQHERTLESIRGLIDAERQLRQFDSALALQSELERLVKGTAAGLDARALAKNDEGRVDLKFSAGHYAAGLPDATAALAACEESMGPNEINCRRLRLHKVEYLLRLGMNDVDARDLRFLQSWADDSTSPADQFDALLLLFRVRSVVGEPGELQALRQRVQEIASSGPELQINPLLKVAAWIHLAEASLRIPDPQDAQRLIDRAISSSGGVNPQAAARAQLRCHLLRGVALLQLHRPAEAAAAFVAVRRDMAEFLGADHPLVHVVGVNLALAHALAGNPHAAAPLVAEAWPKLRDAFGGNSPIFRRMDRLIRSLDGKMDSASRPSSAIDGAPLAPPPKSFEAALF